ncbi:hypothetical protein CCASEI_13305 [Corynebacterium casei LMG S-19264]|uniref:Uncharacterized protein n=1 Tax=Corynebacterium casei LMG S-19264 TaxID=1285583 RepID=A0ABM5PT75_9CORY|nr:hypothetical protein CCASEI_13305 [Corynebacterium casei LMG S-19264]HCJ69882.1 hypothetical protein [Corynebacterium casei]
MHLILVEDSWLGLLFQHSRKLAFVMGGRTRKCDAHHHRCLLNNKEENAENSSKTTGQKIDKGVNTLPPGMKSPTVETMG